MTERAGWSLRTLYVIVLASFSAVDVSLASIRTEVNLSLLDLFLLLANTGRRRRPGRLWPIATAAAAAATATAVGTVQRSNWAGSRYQAAAAAAAVAVQGES